MPVLVQGKQSNQLIGSRKENRHESSNRSGNRANARLWGFRRASAVLRREPHHSHGRRHQPCRQKRG